LIKREKKNAHQRASWLVGRARRSGREKGKGTETVVLQMIVQERRRGASRAVGPGATPSPILPPPPVA
jgi:hypothetical protein